MTVPLASGELTRTTRVTEPEAPTARDPMFQVTTPAATPPGAEADTKLVLAGTVSLTTTFEASAVPVFEVTTPAAGAPGADADTKVMFAGMASLKTTPVAFSFPVFE